jgi:D-alanyl-D-alanine carboxypeptidase
MRRAFIALLCIAQGLLPIAARAASEMPPGATCRAYVVYDIGGGRAIAAYHARDRQPVASLTKLMTAVLAHEHLRFDGRYILNASERATFGTETMRATEMLELMLAPSNNAVCQVVARIVAGSESAFVELMNQRAQELGLRDTHFVNATGLPADGQYSTAEDILTLARVALSHPGIARAMSISEVEVGGKRYEGTLKPLRKVHPGLIGGKTGYTRAAGRCLVLHYRASPADTALARSASDPREYLVVILGSRGVPESFRDAELILRHCGLYHGPIHEWK